MAVKKRDVVFIGKTESGDKTIDMPITRLGNIEDDAEIKAAPTSEDYIPIMDMADGGQMKKTPYAIPSGGGVESEKSHRYYEKEVSLTATGITINMTVFADISEITVNGTKRMMADGYIKFGTCTTKNYTKTNDMLNSSDGSGTRAGRIQILFILGSNKGVGMLNLPVTALTDGDVPFRILTSEIYTTGENTINLYYLPGSIFPFRLEG